MKNITDGYIALHRKILHTSFSKNPLVSWLFINFLLMANHKKNKFIFNNEEITVKEGQFITGLHKLSQQTNISLQSIRTAINILKSTSTITIKSTNKFSLISILNWHLYQGKVTSELTSELTNEQQTTNKQLTTNKNDKNDKNDKKIYILLNLFNSVNPEYALFLTNKNQIKIMGELVDRYGFNEIKNLLIQLPEIAKDIYAPRITSPYSLQNKMADLLIYKTRLASKKGGIVNV